MASNVDTSVPSATDPTTASVRANFATIKTEIEALQGGSSITALGWSKIDSTPTTLSGYGITDALASSLKGAANGLAELDSNSRVPAAQMPVTAVLYQGVWNASTNSPSLADSTGTQGHAYRVSVAGSTSLDGITDWEVGDLAVFDGSVWTKWDNSALASVVEDTSPQLGGDLDMNGNGISGQVPGARATTRTVTGTTGTTTDADINGIVKCTNGSAVTMTIHAAADGAEGYIAQEGAGQVTIAAASGTLRYPTGEGTKTAAQYSGIWWWSNGTDIHIRGGVT